jgi:peroxiredoxin
MRGRPARRRDRPRPSLRSCSAYDVSNGPPRRVDVEQTPDPLPDVTLSDVNGEPVAMRSLAGTPLVLNYWYVQLPPVREGDAGLRRGVPMRSATSVRIVGINPVDDADTATSFAAGKGVHYQQLLDKTRRSVDDLGLTKFPSTVFVAADGTVIEIVGHELTADELRSRIEMYFGA